MTDPFVIFGSDGTLAFLAAKTPYGLLVTGSGASLDRAQISSLVEWLEPKPGDPIASSPLPPLP